MALHYGVTLSPVYTCTPYCLRMVCKQFVHHMHVRVDRTVNKCCTVCIQSLYYKPQTKICQFFVRTQRDVCVSHRYICRVFTSHLQQIDLPCAKHKLCSAITVHTFPRLYMSVPTINVYSALVYLSSTKYFQFQRTRFCIFTPIEDPNNATILLLVLQ